VNIQTNTIRNVQTQGRTVHKGGSNSQPPENHTLLSAYMQQHYE